MLATSLNLAAKSATNGGRGLTSTMQRSWTEPAVHGTDLTCRVPDTIFSRNVWQHEGGGGRTGRDKDQGKLAMS